MAKPALEGVKPGDLLSVKRGLNDQYPAEYEVERVTKAYAICGTTYFRIDTGLIPGSKEWSDGGCYASLNKKDSA